MGCKRFKRTFNPVKSIKNITKATKLAVQGKVGSSLKTIGKGDQTLQGIKYADTNKRRSIQRGLENPYVAAGAAAVATVYGGPAAGAAVTTVAGAAQAKKAQKTAKKETARAQREFDQAFSDLGSALSEDETDLGIPEEEPEVIAEQTVQRRTRRNRFTKTLLSPGLGGGTASLGRPFLLGG